MPTLIRGNENKLKAPMKRPPPPPSPGPKRGTHPRPGQPHTGQAAKHGRTARRQPARSQRSSRNACAAATARRPRQGLPHPQSLDASASSRKSRSAKPWPAAPLPRPATDTTTTSSATAPAPSPRSPIPTSKRDQSSAAACRCASRTRIVLHGAPKTAASELAGARSALAFRPCAPDADGSSSRSQRRALLGFQPTRQLAHATPPTRRNNRPLRCRIRVLIRHLHRLHIRTTPRPARPARQGGQALTRAHSLRARWLRGGQSPASEVGVGSWPCGGSSRTSCGIVTSL